MGTKSRDAQSAGLVCVGTWRQETPESRIWTAEMRLATNVFHREGTDDWFSQISAMVESVQQWHFETWSAVCTKWIKRARSNAADNSNRDILNVLSGATFDLTMKKEMLIELSLFSILPKAAIDASENPWRTLWMVWDPNVVQREMRRHWDMEVDDGSQTKNRRMAEESHYPIRIGEPQTLHEYFCGNDDRSSPS